VSDLASYLVGVWEVERALLDADLGEGRFRGRATFSPLGDGLAWSESGRLTVGAYDGPARRELVLAPAGDAWEVRFSDGRPFHELDLAGGACRVEHPCGDDRYRGEYALRGRDAFEVAWTVRGPRKDQRISSRYERAPAGTHPRQP
jgi:hypothetical protein